MLLDKSTNLLTDIPIHRQFDKSTSKHKFTAHISGSLVRLWLCGRKILYLKNHLVEGLHASSAAPWRRMVGEEESERSTMVEGVPSTSPPSIKMYAPRGGRSSIWSAQMGVSSSFSAETEAERMGRQARARLHGRWRCPVCVCPPFCDL